ncbi:unnamed protein product [Parajaminaea phylloscopi]
MTRLNVLIPLAVVLAVANGAVSQNVQRDAPLGSVDNLVGSSNQGSDFLTNIGTNTGDKIQELGLDVGQEVQDQALQASDKFTDKAENSKLPNLPTLAQGLQGKGDAAVDAGANKVFQGVKTAGGHFQVMSKPAVERGLIGYGDDDAPELTDEQKKQMLADAAKKGVEFVAGAAVGGTVGPPLKNVKLALSAASAAKQLGSGIVEGAADQMLSPPAAQQRGDTGEEDSKRNVILPPLEVFPGAGPYAVAFSDELKSLGDKVSGKTGGDATGALPLPGAKRFVHNKVRARRFGDE